MIEKVLIVKMSSMGDIIHTLPAITDAVSVIPDICFDWVVEEDFAQIPSWHSGIRNVIKISIRRWRKNIFKFSSWKEWCLFKNLIKCEKYDCIIDAQGLIKSAFFVLRIVFGKKYGFDRHSSREFFSSFFCHKVYKINKNDHAIMRIRKLFSKVLNYDCSVLEQNYGIKNNFLNIFSRKKYLFFIYGTTNSKKYWSEDNWKKIIILSINKGYLIKLLWSTKKEYFFAKKLSNGFKEVKILPLLTLQEIATQFLEATALLSIDTGLSHLGAALCCPVLVLYGYTNPDLIGVSGQFQYKLYSSNGNMSGLSVDLVWNTFQSILDCIGRNK